jgi:molybdopterin molybdotransferase
MISFEQARNDFFDLIRSRHGELRKDKRPLVEALGAVLAEDVYAPIHLPPFDQSAMDGYAVRAEECAHARPDAPLTLSVSGIVKAGDGRAVLPAGPKAVKIMTGAMIPKGATAVIEKERVVERGAEIEIAEPIRPFRNVRLAGEDTKEGELVLRQGTRVKAPMIGLLASLGIERVEISGKPKVSILVTGHELVSASERRSEGKIFESNAHFLRTALAELGIVPLRTVVVPDEPGEMKEAVRRALEDSDFLIVTGGVSVGDYDFTKKVFGDLGVKELFWGVAQKPGKPLYIGHRGRSIVAGFPGNPYAVVISYYLYLRPALLIQMGAERFDLRQNRLPLAEALERKAIGRTEFLKGQICRMDGRECVVPLGKQASHMVTSLADTDVLIQLTDVQTNLAPGDEVNVFELPS